VPRALYWDTLDPYHYVRLARGRDGVELLVVGGEDHRTGHADDGGERHRRLEAWMRERFPLEGAVVARWSGEIQEPADGLACIGRSPGPHPNVMVATGDSGNGMTHGALAGILLSDLILERHNPWPSCRIRPECVSARSAPGRSRTSRPVRSTPTGCRPGKSSRSIRSRPMTEQW